VLEAMETQYDDAKDKTDEAKAKLKEVRFIKFFFSVELRLKVYFRNVTKIAPRAMPFATRCCVPANAEGVHLPLARMTLTTILVPRASPMLGYPRHHPSR
jgi:hypothetical protein